eukprot:5930275-Prymnesium_polylepis.1
MTRGGMQHGRRHLMRAVHAAVVKVVDELHEVAFGQRLELRHLVEQRDLIARGLSVALCRLLDLEHDGPSRLLRVDREPDGGEVPPAHLAQHAVPVVVEHLAHFDRV